MKVKSRRGTNLYMRRQNDICGIAVVDSPLQLLNTLNMMETTSYGQIKWDLLLLEEPAFGKILFDRITSLGIFRKTYFVESAWSKLRNLQKQRIKWAGIYLNRNNIYKIWTDLSCDFCEYQYMSFCPAADFFVCNFAHFFNNTIKYIWLEDGMSSYANYGEFLQKGTAKDFARKMLRHNSGKKNIECQYLYRPEMANYGVPFTRVKARFLDPDSETARIADVIFDFKPHDIIKEKYIYFDNAFAKDGINTNDHEILRTVSEIVGKDNLLVKVHPRNDPSIYEGTGLKVNKKNYIPWEIYYFHKEMLENKILIGAVSTALLSPFLYFDSRQKVISLVEMLELDKMNEKFRKLVIDIKKIVMKQHPEVFTLPSDYKELKDALEEVVHE